MDEYEKIPRYELKWWVKPPQGLFKSLSSFIILLLGMGFSIYYFAEQSGWTDINDWTPYHQHSSGVEFLVRQTEGYTFIKARNPTKQKMKIEVKLNTESAYSWTTEIAPGKMSETRKYRTQADSYFTMDANPSK
jgi:hypothetical protein